MNIIIKTNHCKDGATYFVDSYDYMEKHEGRNYTTTGGVLRDIESLLKADLLKTKRKWADLSEEEIENHVVRFAVEYATGDTCLRDYKLKNNIA